MTIADGPYNAFKKFSADQAAVIIGVKRSKLDTYRTSVEEGVFRDFNFLKNMEEPLYILRSCNQEDPFRIQKWSLNWKERV